MAYNVQDVVKLALDSRHGVGEAAKFSKQDSQAALREALIEMNGGSTKFDRKTMRSARGAEIYAIIEEVIQKEENAYWENNDVVNRICEYRNLALGDQQQFYIPDKSFYAVADISEGNTGLRRQRLEGGTYLTVKTSLRGIKLYEEANRVLAGRVDFNDMIDRAVASIAKDNYERVMNAWNGIGTATLGSIYAPTSTGSYSEGALLDVISHVEAETGIVPTLYGSKKALRTIAPAIATSSEAGKNEMNQFGYIGKFYGCDVIALTQAHKTNSTEFLLDDDTIYIMSSADKPIKYITEGEGIIEEKTGADNADLSYEWLYTERTGIAVVVNEVFGKYTFG